MTRVCRCGADMALRSRDEQAVQDGGFGRASTETWWDCACGRSVADFSATTSDSVSFTNDEDDSDRG